MQSFSKYEISKCKMNEGKITLQCLTAHVGVDRRDSIYAKLNLWIATCSNRFESHYIGSVRYQRDGRRKFKVICLQ